MVKNKEIKNSVYQDLDVDANKLIDSTVNIDDLLILWKEEDESKKLLEARVERLKNKIRAFLKERKWKRYDDSASKISVTMSILKRSSIDKKQLQLILTEAQLAQITRVSTSEMMRIITPETRKRLKNII